MILSEPYELFSHKQILLAVEIDLKKWKKIDIHTKWDTCNYKNFQSAFELVPKYIMHISIIVST